MGDNANGVLLSAGELAAVLRGVERGPLALRPPEVPPSGPDEAPRREEVRGALGALRDPPKRVDFRSMHGPRAVTTGTLFWSDTDPGRIFAVTMREESYHLAEWTTPSLELWAEGVLATGDAGTDPPFSVATSAEGLLVWLGVVDDVYGERVGALVSAEPVLGLYDVGRVRGRLQDSLFADVRWPLRFLSSVMARPHGASLTEGDVAAGLGELAGAGLLERFSGSGARSVYELSEAGAGLADETLATVSCLALGIAERRSDGVVGYESMLLTRSPNRLVFHAIGAGAGIAAFPTAGAVDEVLASAFAPAAG